MAQLLAVSILISLCNFIIHAIATGIISGAARRCLTLTRSSSLFLRTGPLLVITTMALMLTHVAEILVWTGGYLVMGIAVEDVTAFEFAFENYTALGYGDAVATEARLIGPVTALNGLLLVGWSVAVIFDVIRNMDLCVGR